MAEVAQQHGCGHDDRLRWDAVQALRDQHRQGDGVDAKRGEVDTLEAHEVTQHVAPDAEHEPAMHYEGEQHGQRPTVSERATKIPNPTMVLMPPTTRNATRWSWTSRISGPGGAGSAAGRIPGEQLTEPIGIESWNEISSGACR
jgi:hypothetical protein